jgi:hypothetical protein
MSRRRFLLFLGGGLIFGCDREAEARKDATRQRRIGTWLREEEQDGVLLRRVVVLSADKSFKETAKVTAKDGSVETESHSGVWFFDGVNFKRKYTRLNDRPLSNSSLTYSTFRLEQSALKRSAAPTMLEAAR